MRAGPTNAGWQDRTCDAAMSLEAYDRIFASLPADVRDAVTSRWGAPSGDPMCDGKAIRLPLRRFGNVVVAVQPARGYNIDPKSTYHSPDLVPPSQLSGAVFLVAP
jgi:cobaltochelatase CobN